MPYHDNSNKLPLCETKLSLSAAFHYLGENDGSVAHSKGMKNVVPRNCVQSHYLITCIKGEPFNTLGMVWLFVLF